MKKVTLLNLTFRFVPGEHVLSPAYLPYGCLSLIASLKSAGYSVDFRDYQFNKYDDPQKIENMLDFLKDPADIIGVSCLSREMPYCVFLCAELKAKYPEKKIVLGANGPSGVAEKLIKEFPFIDFVVIGEGDHTFVELVKAIDEDLDFSLVNGIAFRNNGEVLVTEDRERINDLDSLPLPSYEDVDLSLYQDIYLSCGRGCPFRCTFCSQTGFWKGKMVQKELKTLFRELDILSRLKPDCGLDIKVGAPAPGVPAGPAHIGD